jgi:hypothetical protein
MRIPEIGGVLEPEGCLCIQTALSQTVPPEWPMAGEVNSICFLDENELAEILHL